jgi:hypothetical protein
MLSWFILIIFVSICSFLKSTNAFEKFLVESTTILRDNGSLLFLPKQFDTKNNNNASRKLDTIYFSSPFPSYAGFRMTGSSVSNLGASVYKVNDVNGDTYKDLVVGGPNYNSNAGFAVVLFGSAFPTDITTNSPTAAFAGSGTERAGGSVCGLGDLNGDGKNEFLIGAQGYNGDAGRVYVIFGAANLPKTNSLAALGTLGITLTNTVAGEFCGHSVGGGSFDINGDNILDIIIGCHGANSNTGKVFIVFGKTTMTSLSLTSMTASDGFAIASPTGPGGNFGFSVCFTGDVNNDGRGDFAIGKKKRSLDCLLNFITFSLNCDCIFFVFYRFSRMEFESGSRVFDLWIHWNNLC